MKWITTFLASLCMTAVACAATVTPVTKAAATAATVAPPQAAVSWVAPTLNTDGTAISGPITYNVYQGLTGALVKVLSNLTTTSTVITTGLTPGSSQCFAVSAVVNGAESAQSAFMCATIPNPIPGSPTTVVVVISGN